MSSLQKILSVDGTDEKKTNMRDIRFDTMRGILIILVVFAHVIEQLTEVGWEYIKTNNAVLYAIYSVIYSFHMPLFIFVSGYFSKSFRDKDSWAKGAVRSSFIPFVLANLFYWLLFSRSVTTFFYPQWAMWYLLSLFCWKLVVIPLSKIKGMLLISLAMSLYIGMTDASRFMSLHRTISFFPYFLAGYLISPEKIERIRSIRKPIPVMVCAVSVLSAVYLAAFAHMTSSVYTMAASYSEIGLGTLKGVILRGVALILGFSGVFWMLALTGSKHSIFQNLGRNTLPVYIFHPLLIKLYLHFSLPLFSDTCAILLFALAFSGCTCTVLGNRFFSKLFSQSLTKVSSVFIKE